jgi:hypothetical protein
VTGCRQTGGYFTSEPNRIPPFPVVGISQIGGNDVLNLKPPAGKTEKGFMISGPIGRENLEKNLTGEEAAIIFCLCSGDVSERRRYTLR